MLAKIPLIPALLETAEDEAAGMAVAQMSDSKKTTLLQEGREVTRSDRDGDQQLDDRGGEGDSSQQVHERVQPATLLQWISSNNQSNIYHLAHLCIRNLEQVCSITIELLVLDNEKF
jgi:hypothetical protein